MTSNSSDGAPEPPAKRRFFRGLPPIETYPGVVAFVQRPLGKLLLFGTFGLMMKLIAPGMWIAERHMWLFITIGAAAVSLSGRFRPLALVLCTGVLLAIVPGWYDFSAVQLTIKQEGVLTSVDPSYLRAATLLSCVPIAAAAMWLARHFRNHPLGRRPLLVQHLVYFTLVGLAVSHALRGIPQVLLWTFTLTFSAYFWYLAYAIIDQRARRPGPMLYQFGTFAPFFASTPIPMGKGTASWRSVESRTDEDLAVTQLKGLKLLFWALLLKQFLLLAFREGLYKQVGVVPLKSLFDVFLKSGDVPLPGALFSILANFPERVLVIAVGGHLIIAIARLAGFRLLRNTYRPMTARTIAEFWNRYVYYFKEVLVHVYFYPTYVRCFKRHPRVRMAFATLMAAGVGNYIFHFMENYSIVRYGLVEALARSQTYAFYCVLLATGIVISQLRTRRSDPTSGWFRGHVRPIAGVAAFYCFLSIFDGPQQHVTLAQHFEFLYKVLGMDRWIRPI